MVEGTCENAHMSECLGEGNEITPQVGLPFPLSRGFKNLKRDISQARTLIHKEHISDGRCRRACLPVLGVSKVVDRSNDLLNSLLHTSNPKNLFCQSVGRYPFKHICVLNVVKCIAHHRQVKAYFELSCSISLTKITERMPMISTHCSYDQSQNEV